MPSADRTPLPATLTVDGVRLGRGAFWTPCVSCREHCNSAVRFKVRRCDKPRSLQCCGAPACRQEVANQINGARELAAGVDERLAVAGGA